jgi:hypothetical protein
MRRIAIVCLLVAAFATPAAADWKVGHFTDKLTDRKETYAATFARDTAVRLYVGCMNGRIFPQIEFPRRVGVYEIGLNYRFDNDKVVPRIATMSQDGRSIWLWILDAEAQTQRIQRSKRLRLQIQDIVLDFDLTGADAAIRPIRCK